MDLFTAISIIVLALIILTPILGLTTVIVARRHNANIISRLMEEIAEQEQLIFALKTNSKVDVKLIDELTIALNKTNKQIEKTIDDLRQSKSAYNLLTLLNENYVLTIKDLRAELENQS